MNDAHGRTAPSGRVLVLEPLPSLAGHLAAIAGICGCFSVHQASTPEDALGVLRFRTVDVILAGVDRMSWPELPELTAVRLAAPGAIVIAVTDALDAGCRRTCETRGANLVLDLRTDVPMLHGFLRDRCAPCAATVRR